VLEHVGRGMNDEPARRCTGQGETGAIHRLRPWLGRHRRFLAALTVAVLLRLAIAPLWHGQDYTVWTLATSAALRGVNIFAHHPRYPAGPFAYFPLFLYIELPLRWLADVSGTSYVFIGKLPIIAADSVIGLQLYRAGIQRGRTSRASAVVAAAYLFNPLALYDGAAYGRFDAIALTFLLAAAEHARRAGVDMTARASLALGIAAKTFPAFTLPVWLASDRRRGRWTTVATIGGVLAALSIPFAGSLPSYLHDIVWYDSTKTPQGSSVWVFLDGAVSPDAAEIVGSLGLVVFVVGTLWIARSVTVRSLDIAVAAVLLLFIACSKVVLEQYLLWPIPALLVLVHDSPRTLRRSSVAMITLLTVLGLLNCESFHPFGRNVPIFGLLVVAGTASWLVIARRATSRRCT
jgi:hypothetical protein